MPLAFAAAACVAAALSGPPADVRFGELFRMPIGPAGLEPSDRLRALDGKPVRMTGYLVRDDVDSAEASLILSPLPVVLGHEDDDLADDLPPTAVTLRMPQALAARAMAWRPGLVRVTGTLCAGTARESGGRLSALHLLLDEASAGALLNP